MIGGKTNSLFELTTQDAVARIAGRYLDAAARGLNKLENPDDPKGLHGFRIAIRRLRSLLRAYRPWLGRVAGRKVRRRLRDLTRSTNAWRDADVQLEWLSTQNEQFTAQERPGRNWLLRRLRDRKRRSYRSTGTELSRDFADAVQLIGSRMDDVAEVEPREFRDVWLELLEAAAEEFRKRIAAISGPDDEKNVHECRIRVKRLRYLIEPLRKELAEARTAVRSLKKLQTLLGELHDMHVLEGELATAAEEAATEKARRLHRLALDGDAKSLKYEQRRDESPGLVMLAARAREHRDGLYALLERNWLADRARAQCSEIAALAQHVTASKRAAAVVRLDSRDFA